MEIITVEALLIASVISGVVAGHRLSDRKLALFSAVAAAVILAASPIAFGQIGGIASGVIAACCALAMAVGRIGHSRQTHQS